MLSHRSDSEEERRKKVTLKFIKILSPLIIIKTILLCFII